MPSSALAHIRQESLDIYNRLHSIAEDAEFVKVVAGAYASIPVISNLRCGAWYVDPSIASVHSVAAYFKSTDGHCNNWSFNLRRPNLQLLPVLAEHRSMILVDSTRAGKRLPDALSKTVPIWCAVVNRAMLLRYPDLVDEGYNYDPQLYTPPNVVSKQEHAQIEERLDGWARDLANSSYGLPRLSNPLRPLWVTPASRAFPELCSNNLLENRYIPVICVSASKQIHEGEGRRALAGFTYVQGSGDDHELWGMGLTPQLFWKHHDYLLSTSRDELEDQVRRLVKNQKAPSVVNSTDSSDRLNKPDTLNTDPPTPIPKVQGRLILSSISRLPVLLPTDIYSLLEAPAATDNLAAALPDRRKTAYIVIGSSESEPPSLSQAHIPLLFVTVPPGKRGASRFGSYILPRAMKFIDNVLCQSSTPTMDGCDTSAVATRSAIEHEHRMDVCIACESGTDTSVGVMLAVLQVLFDDNGHIRPLSEYRENVSRPQVTKKSIRTRLEWIIAAEHRANPPRITLNRVNEYLMAPANFRRTIEDEAQDARECPPRQLYICWKTDARAFS